MGPLRSLGEKLLEMKMDDIRPICLDDFKASLTTIRPSVSKQGLKEYEDWAKEFGWVISFWMDQLGQRGYGRLL